jgi:hypothetical protein
MYQKATVRIGRVLFGDLFRIMTHILWSPEEGVCGQCGIKHTFVRRCTCESFQTKLCKGCWSEFIDECNLTHGPWKDDVARDWCVDIDLRLVFEGEDGTSQESRLLN